MDTIIGLKQQLSILTNQVTELEDRLALATAIIDSMTGEFGIQQKNWTPLFDVDGNEIKHEHHIKIGILVDGKGVQTTSVVIRGAVAQVGWKHVLEKAVLGPVGVMVEEMKKRDDDGLQ